MRRPIIFVAELSSMHRRNKSLAYEMMRQAKLAGASYAKFQLGWPEDDELRYIDDWAQDIARWSEDIGIPWFASIWSQDGLVAAQSVGMQRFKLSHQVALNEDYMPLVSQLISTGKPVYVSGQTFNSPNVYSIYVHADEYPTYEPHMPKEFGSSGWYGYSSHAHGIGDAVVACARGARYIEKHVTLDKSDLWVRDTSFALDFREFRRMVEVCEEVSRVIRKGNL